MIRPSLVAGAGLPSRAHSVPLRSAFNSGSTNSSKHHRKFRTVLHFNNWTSNLAGNVLVRMPQNIDVLAAGGALFLASSMFTESLVTVLLCVRRQRRQQGHFCVGHHAFDGFGYQVFSGSCRYCAEVWGCCFQFSDQYRMLTIAMCRLGWAAVQ